MGINLSIVRDSLFKKIHTSSLIYNTCWEDPMCDRHLLNIQTDSKILMITSAGCNALDYLLDAPQEIHCVDMNPRQNALLELKISLFKQADFNYLYRFFGEGVVEEAREYYQVYLQSNLSDYARKFWDRNIGYFSGKGWRKSFYFNGTSGMLARMMVSYLKVQPQLFERVRELFSSDSLEKQQELYTQIEPRLFGGFITWMLNRHSMVSLAGVPRAQRDLIMQTYQDEGVAGYVKDCLRHIFYHVPVKDNYFWYVYVNGKYSENCCPSYLKKGHFETIKDRVDRIHLHTTTISQYLKENPNIYSHFVLLDHQDWLAAHNRKALAEEWELILKNSTKGTRILLRSAANEVNFFPDFVHDRVQFEKEKTSELHRKDRVGTYGSVYLGIVK
jgi:S-adenosylmethionine-diacylglycerol 3-amino-3-carboxypropyl transferase